jgi:hypothetical protein
VKECEASFELAINFPGIYEALMRMLKDNRKIEVHNAIVDGYYFKEAICAGMNKLDIVYCDQEENDRVGSYIFEFHVKQRPGTPVKKIQPNVLYHLRPNHPVIDAVAYVNQTLVLIQVSLSKYEVHKSKAGDLQNIIQGCECDIEPDLPKWLEYYRRRLPETDSLYICIHFP